MPSFCRHRRLESTCPVCSRQRRQEERTARAASRPARPAPVRRSGTRRPAPAGVSVRRVARAADDGYASELVMGLRASADAARLATALGRAAAAIERLHADPPATLADAARLRAAGEAEEALWLAFLVAAIGTGEGDDPFAQVERARVPWATGEAPSLDDVAAAAGGVDRAKLPEAITAYRAWAQRSGGQAAGLAGEPSWTAERRFERAFERLALPGLARAPRYRFLRLAGELGLADLAPSSLQLAVDPRDAVAVAAKRVFGIGDPVLLERRAADLARACGVPIGTLEAALRLWGADEPADGSGAAIDAGVEARARAALGLPADGEDEADAAADAG